MRKEGSKHGRKFRVFIFIIKSQKLTTKGVKIYGVLIKLMNQNFSKSKFLHESSKLEHFQWGVKILDLSKV